MRVYHVRVTSSADMQVLYENDRFVAPVYGVSSLAVEAANVNPAIMRGGVTVEVREQTPKRKATAA